jgi:ABC-2 type transport system permease protein
MKPATVLRKTLRDSRGMTIGIGLVIGGIGLMDVLIFPSYRDSLADFDMPPVFEGFLGEAASIATPEGFLTTEFFSWVPLLLITLAIIGGSAALAGEEGAGTLDLLLAQPIRRRRVVLEKAAGLTIAVALAAAASLVGFLIGALWVDIGVGFGRFAQAVVNMIPLALLFLALSLWASAALPSRGAAAMPVAGFAVISFVLQLVAQSVPSLHVIQKASPFYWAESSRILLHGFDWVRAGLMLAIAALILLLAIRSFERRDIAAGNREWSLPRPRIGRRRRAPEPETLQVGRASGPESLAGR